MPNAQQFHDPSASVEQARKNSCTRNFRFTASTWEGEKVVAQKALNRFRQISGSLVIG
jgi:hypothetical protein